MSNENNIENKENIQVNNSNNSNIIVLITISCLLFGFVGPLVAWLSMKDRFNKEENSYLIDLLNFELTLLIAMIIFTVIKIMPVVGVLVSCIGSFAVGAINIVVLIIALVKITNNTQFKFPLTLNLLK